MKIEKLERPWCNNNSGCGGASFNDVIDKINEIIDALDDEQKKYNEALERARKLKEMYPQDAPGYIEVFPELRESEDEKIREDLIGGLMWQRDNLKSEGPHDNNLILPGFCLNVGKHLAYLEKQKESLHISESCKENPEYFTSQCGDNRFELIDKAKRDIVAKTNIKSSPNEMKVLDNILFRAWQMGWLSKYDVIVPDQKPVEWSDEDENMVWNIISIVGQSKSLRQDAMIAWLKSLRPQKKEDLPKWKKVDANYQYPLCLTREYDVNGDYQYCLSSGKIYDGCEYISIAELELLPRKED